MARASPNFALYWSYIAFTSVAVRGVISASNVWSTTALNLIFREGDVVVSAAGGPAAGVAGATGGAPGVSGTDPTRRKTFLKLSILALSISVRSLSGGWSAASPIL